MEREDFRIQTINRERKRKMNVALSHSNTRNPGEKEKASKESK
jgi:hypothetical protein